jgi:SAM-dependent methyltransferase
MSGAVPHGYVARDSCPCCAAPRSTAIPRAESQPPAESLNPEAHGKFLSGYSPGRLFFSYVECGNCGAVYCPVYYSQEQLDRLYSRQAENMSDAPLAARLKTQAGYARLLMAHNRRATQFLEIGADTGSFAYACASQAPFNQFWLYEPNLDVHHAIEERLQGRNVAIRATPFKSADLGPGSVSTAAAIHVLDHLLDPLRALQEIRAVLEPEGVVLLVTHDASSLLARALGRRWPPFTLQHPHLFTPRSLTSILKRAQLEPLQMIKAMNHFPVFYLARAACSVLGLSKRLVPPVDGPLMGIRLGNIAVVARRSG